jgi:hypothetical protein
MGVVSFRLSEAEEFRLWSMGVSPGARAKELLEQELRLLEVGETMRFLVEHRIRSKLPIGRMIREIRDEY